MSDSGNGTANSWTVIAPEETVAETVRPVAEGAEPHEDLPSDRFTTKPAGGAAERGSGTSPVFSEESCSVERQQAPQETESETNKVTTAHMEDTAPDPAPAPDLTVTPDPIAVSKPPLPSSPEVLSPGPTHDLSLTSDPNLTSVSDDPPPPSIAALPSSQCDADTLSQSAAPAESSAPSSPDPDLFSDSYTHISPEPAYPPTPETLGAQELAQEEEGLIQEEEGLIQEEEGLIQEEEGLIQEGGATHQLSGEGHAQEEEESELSQRVSEVGKRADLPSDSEVGLERAEEQGAEGESGLRRRRPSLQSALERIGRCGGEEEEEEEDEEEGEEFRLPPRGEEDSGFSLNKCILGAVILLGLGTIFFSEGEYDVGRELRDAETPGKQEWLNPEARLVDVDKAELLSKQSLDKQQITVLQAQLQAQKEELKVVQGQAAEGAKERLRREEVEKENAQQVDPDPDSATGLPPTVLEEEGSQTTGSPVEEAERSREGEKTEKDWAGGKERKKERYEQGEQGKRWKDKGEQREWKEDGKKERKAEKEWKKGKHDQEKDGKGWKQLEEKKRWKGKEERRGEWKNEKASRGEEGKRWKEKEEKKEWKERGERKDGKKGKHDHWNEEKEWKDKSDTKEKKGKKEHEWKKGKDEGRGEKEWRKDEGRGEKEWKKGKDEGMRGEKEWRKSKDGGKGWKDQGERKEWKSDKDFKKKDGKREGTKEWQEDRKPWQGKDKEGSRDGERRGWKEEKKDGDWKKDKAGGRKSKDKYSQEKSHQQQYDYREREEEERKKEKKESVWPGPGSKSPPQSHRQPPLEQPDYWDRQRARLQRNPSPAAQCTSVESCAQAEGLVPVPLPEFQALLTAYLAKAEAVGVEASKRDELSKLAVEFFKDGVFTHDQMSFQDFAEDVADILEDMVEKEDDDDDVDGDDDDDDDEKERGIEEEMDGFEDEAMKLFTLPGGGEKEQRKKGEWKKESGRGRG